MCYIHASIILWCLKISSTKLARLLHFKVFYPSEIFVLLHIFNHQDIVLYGAYLASCWQKGLQRSSLRSSVSRGCPVADIDGPSWIQPTHHRAQLTLGHPRENVFKKAFKTFNRGRMEQKVYKTTLQTPRSEKKQKKKTSAACREVHGGVDIHSHGPSYNREVRYS